MRQWNQYGCVNRRSHELRAGHGERRSDDVLKSCTREKPRQRKRSDGKDQSRLQQLEQRIQPRAAQSHFARRGAAITATAGSLSRKTRRHRRHVHTKAHVSVIRKTGAHHPPHQLPSRTSGKGARLIDFNWTRCLPHEQNALSYAPAEHRVRTLQIPSVDAPVAGAMRCLQPLERRRRTSTCEHRRILAMVLGRACSPAYHQRTAAPTPRLSRGGLPSAVHTARGLVCPTSPGTPPTRASGAAM